jgi:hypothetical protein
MSLERKSTFVSHGRILNLYLLVQGVFLMNLARSRLCASKFSPTLSSISVFHVGVIQKYAYSEPCRATLLLTGKKWLMALITIALFSVALPAHSGSRPLIQLRNHFSQTVGLVGRMISPLQGRYLNTGQHKHTINTFTHQTSMPWMGFEPTIPGSERAKTVHALYRAATVTGDNYCLLLTNHKQTPIKERHCPPRNIILCRGLQVNYFPSFQLLSAVKHAESSAKVAYASRPAMHR